MEGGEVIVALRALELLLLRSGRSPLSREVVPIDHEDRNDQEEAGRNQQHNLEGDQPVTHGLLPIHRCHRPMWGPDGIGSAGEAAPSTVRCDG